MPGVYLDPGSATQEIYKLSPRLPGTHPKVKIYEQINRNIGSRRFFPTQPPKIFSPQPKYNKMSFVSPKRATQKCEHYREGRLNDEGKKNSRGT